MSQTAEVGFFARYAPPELSSTRVTAAEINLAFAALPNPDAPVAFD